MEVVDALEDNAILGARAVRTWRLAQHLMKLGDEVPVGVGTLRCIVAASALYAADRLLSRKQLTQRQVAAAASRTVPTSRNRIARYSRELVDAYEAEHGTDDPGVGFKEERDTLCWVGHAPPPLPPLRARSLRSLRGQPDWEQGVHVE